MKAVAFSEMTFKHPVDFIEGRNALSGDAHIDHFRKRDMFPNLTFDWNNLFVDGMSESYGARFKDKNIKKGDYALLISPAEENVERFFSYMQNGEIVVAEGLSADDAKRAAFTIKAFNLTDILLPELPVNHHLCHYN